MHTAVQLPHPSLLRGRFAYSIPDNPVPDFATGNLEGRITAYTDEALFESVGVRVAFTERAGGFSKEPFASLNLKKGIGDEDRAVSRNRAAVRAAFGCLEAPCIVPNQVHGTRILQTNSAAPSDVSNAWQWAQEGCDAVVVGCAGLGAMLSFADCLPLALVAPTGAFAVVHCGWRGAVARLASQTLAKLVDQAGCSAGQVNAYIGPYIHAECFEVGQDVCERFEEEFGYGCIASPRHVDLAAAVAADLVHAGLNPERFADVGECTVCAKDRFFSYRAEGGNTGRHGAFAVRMGAEPCSPADQWTGKERG